MNGLCQRILRLVLVCLAMALTTQAARAQQGACCLVTGGCTISSATACTNGTFLVGQPCAVCNDTQLPCCIPGQGCVNVIPDICRLQGGTRVPSCAQCQGVTGACCYNAGGVNNCITNVTAATCANLPGSTFFPNQATCPAGSCANQNSLVCCRPNGACSLVTTASACNGTIITGAAGCSPNPCPTPTGACCRKDGSCFVTTPVLCRQADGRPVGGACTATTCRKPRPCCLRNAAGQVVCVLVGDNQECIQRGGQPLPAASTCPPASGPDVCVPPPFGVCCNAQTGACRNVTSAAQCQTNETFILCVTCSAQPCDPRGACCFINANNQRECQVLPESACDAIANSTFTQGVGCSPTLCPVRFGACCLGTAGCQIVPEGQCPASGSFQLGGTCDSNPCFVACCYPDGSCVTVAPADCQFTILAPGTTCSPDICPKGACCDEPAGVCYTTYRRDCEARGHTWLGAGVTCPTDRCGIQTGACCFPVQVGAALFPCRITTKLGCISVTGAPGSWLAGETCRPNPCCPADFDGSDGRDVSDIFRFLSAWFAGCP